MFDKKLLRNFDYTLLIVVLLISVIGVIIITSATQLNPTGDSYYYTRRQIAYIAAGLLVLLTMLSIDYHSILRIAKPLYIINLLLLTAVFVPGLGRAAGGGAQRWLSLGIIDIQPAEFAKIIIIITLAKFLVDQKNGIEDIYDLILPIGHVLVPMGLIFLQPDLGTAMVFIAILFGGLFFYRVKLKLLGYLIGAGILVGVPSFWLLLHEYQRQRLIVFLNPSNIDPLGDGFHLWQSMVAIGSGGITGKGLFEGTQNKLEFLPEAHTDFVFSVIGEEFGLIGASIVLLLFLILIYRILKIAYLSKDFYGTVICGGVATMLLFQMVVNVAMTVSMMPVTGLPLPFISYGGSGYLMNMMAIGLVLNVGMRRHKIMF
ncbi:rod shape-determining protein RodA [Natranaerobius thermophilus]|uniref:Peptidoglycan glycosyltransferase RodA n=1 Tax=Natranaerobius thermophilus (strain ATCC BAA-1301 / DSM 18059 / JW/NM-WN-LF) TaxID=457570 RepID=B2A6A7_NATTJ|nr:rod shape-determining protein RodA [Natranaerobius thermophilus]ACB84118.1 rod shape-determining protein RodA [Natranaerobius thermophilus JW/NM-WN-LF]